MKKLYFYRYLNFWLSTTFALFVPLGAIAKKYSLFSQTKAVPPAVKATAAGMIVVTLMSLYFFKHIWRMYRHMDDNNLKRFVSCIFRLVPLIFMYFSLLFAEIHMANFKFIMQIAITSNVIATIFVFNHLRLINKIERVKKIAKP